MTLKSVLATAIICSSTLFSFAQNQQNTLPTTGNIGVGTTTPTTKLEINGNVKVDSCLIVKDTSFFERDVKMDEKLIVSGSAIIKEDVFVPNMQEAVNAELNSGYYAGLVIDPTTGKIVKKDFDVFAKSVVTAIYQQDKPPCPPGTIIQSPIWSNAPNVIFSHPCPGVNVGIGTETPDQRLHVSGNLRTSNKVIIGGFALNPTGAMLQAKIYPNSTDDLFEFGSWTETFLKLDNDGLLNARAIRIKNTVISEPAFVVENPTDTLLMLENDGLLRSRAIRVDAESWADYVFDEDYKLAPLSEVKNYIEENKHLPGVPSEEEVLENGINVAETDAMLLKKLEEMTLYIIELEERLDALESRTKDTNND